MIFDYGEGGAVWRAVGASQNEPLDTQTPQKTPKRTLEDDFEPTCYFLSQHKQDLVQKGKIFAASRRIFTPKTPLKKFRRFAANLTLKIALNFQKFRFRFFFKKKSKFPVLEIF